MDKIRLGAVSYRNAKPLVYGIGLPPMTDIMELYYQYPARLVKELQEGTIDIGLIPVAAISKVPGARIVGQHGIAADGVVGSVALFSDRPIDEIEEVVLDYQSRTSVELVKILLRDHWHKKVHYVASETDDYINDITGTRAGLIIGDRALMHADRFRYVYDLSEAWKLHTGLPFVFAVWVATKELSPEFVDAFEKANEIGLLHLDQLAEEWAVAGVDMLSYFQDKIHYHIDDSKREGLRLFLSKLEEGSIA